MDSNYHKNADTRPKRRKDKDNPYELITVGINTQSAAMGADQKALLLQLGELFPNG